MVAPQRDTASDYTHNYGLPPLGPERELPPPGDSMAVGRTLVRNAYETGAPTYQYWKGDLYRWHETHWETCQTSELNGWLYQQTERAYYVKKDKKGEDNSYAWAPSKTKIVNLQHALSESLLNKIGEAEACMAFQNGVLNQKTNNLDPHTPARFNLNSLPFSYNKDAQCPKWEAFLESILPGDSEAQGFLQEWFGYVLSGRTDLHKMVSLVGPPRCGKGTIARILEALLGTQAVSSPTMSSLGGQFGRQPLIGKSLAILSDARWHAAAVTEAVPHFLAISGGDAVDVPRKNKTDWHGLLGVRFMFMGNDEPNFRDASNALNVRMLQVQFRESFEGRENHALTHELTQELAGIMNWALAGLTRLDQRGHLVQPASAAQLAENVRRAASPYAAFADDCLEIAPGGVLTATDALMAYQRWAVGEGRDLDRPSKSSLSRGLRAHAPKITSRRRNLDNGLKETDLLGVRLVRMPGQPLPPPAPPQPPEPPPGLWLAAAAGQPDRPQRDG